MAAPNQMNVRPGQEPPMMDRLARLLPEAMQNQSREVQMAYLQRLVQHAGTNQQQLNNQTQRTGVPPNQGFQNLPNGGQFRPGSPNLNNINVQPGQQGMPMNPNSPGMLQRMRPPLGQPQGQPGAGHTPLTPQMQMRPPLQQQQSTAIAQGAAQQGSPAQRQMNAQAVQAQALFLQDQARLAQAKLAAGPTNGVQTPSQRPTNLPQQVMQGSPSAQMSQVHPLQAQAQINQNMGQGQMPGLVATGPGMARPQMRPQGVGLNNGGPRMGNGGQVQVQNGGQPGQVMGNMGQRRPMMGSPAGQGGEGGGLRMHSIMREPQKLQTWLKVFDNLDWFKQQKQANRLTPEVSQQLDEVIQLGPEFFTRVRESLLSAAQAGQNNQGNKPNGQQQGPLVGLNQMQLQQQMAGQQNFNRPPHQINGQASVMANRNALQQQVLQQLPQLNGMHGQGAPQVEQSQPNLQGSQNGAGGSSPSVSQGQVQTGKEMLTIQDFETIFERMNNLPEAKRAEHLRTQGGINVRTPYFTHIKTKLSPEAQAALFTRLPDIAQFYQAYQRELTQARLAFQQAAMLASAAQSNGIQAQSGPGVAPGTPQMGNTAISQAITSNPLPNLQMPVGRQRASGSAQGQPLGMGQNGGMQQMQSPNFAPAGLQLAQTMSSPGGSTQGTPSFRAAALATMQRSGTPSRMNPMGQRGSPNMSHAGTPRIPDSEAIAAVHAAAQSSVNDLAAGSQQYNTGPRMQIQMPNSRQGGPVNGSSINVQTPTTASQRNGSQSGPSRVGLQPSGNPVESIATISDTVAESARRPPSPKPFPRNQAQRATLTSGLAGMGLVLHTPALSLRPGSFDRISVDLAAAMGKPGMSAKPSRGALFDRPGGIIREEKVIVDEEMEDLEPVAESAEEVGIVMDDPVLEEPYFFPINDRKRKISEIAAGVQKNLAVSDGAASFIRELADEFIDSIIDAGSRLAKHRKVDKLETKDVQYHLEREYGMYVPGFESDNLRVEQVKSKLEMTKVVGASTDAQTTQPSSKSASAGVISRSNRLAAVQQAKQAAMLANIAATAIEA